MNGWIMDYETLHVIQAHSRQRDGETDKDTVKERLANE